MSIVSKNSKQSFYDEDGVRVLIDESTQLLPIVGNFNVLDDVNAYSVYQKDDKLLLKAILVCHNLRELYMGNSKYGNNVFCLASDLPKDKRDEYISEIITLKDVPEYLESVPKSYNHR